jgi:hypothetical protein
VIAIGIAGELRPHVAEFPAARIAHGWFGHQCQLHIIQPLTGQMQIMDLGARALSPLHFTIYFEGILA